MCTIEKLHQWFNRYVDGFEKNSSDPDLTSHLELKRDHTSRVCENAVWIGNKLGLPARDLLIVEIAALFHDIGRFEQYKRYRTFADADSENHAKLGVRVLREEGVTKRLPPEEVPVLLHAVRDHNLPRYTGETGRRRRTDKERLVTRIVRDADKIDIFEITCNLYDGGLQAITGLSSGGGISDRVCRMVLDGKTVMWKSLLTANDFKIMQLGWAADINFSPSAQRILEKEYLRRIRDTLPSHPMADAVYERATSSLAAHLHGGSHAAPR